MKIFYTTASPVPSLAANSVHVMKMAQALASLEHKVTLITKKSPTSVKNVFDFYGVKPIFTFWSFYCLPKTLGLYLHALSVSCLARLFNVDVVYTRCLTTAWFAALLGNQTIFERHDSFDDARNVTAEQLFKKLIVHKNLKKVVVISQALSTYFSQKYAIAPDKIMVAPDGADPISSTSLPSPLQRRENRLIAGYVGHLYKGRGIDVIIALANNLPNIDFHIIGGIPKDVDFWKNQTTNTTNLFFHGHVNPANTSAFIMNCDILLAPYQKTVSVIGSTGDTSRWMSPLKIFEYMASGKPIVCSDLPVLREVLEKDKTALLCQPDDLPAWKNALQQLADNPAFAQKLGQQAQEKFLKYYTWKKRAEFILNSVFGKNK